MVSLWSLTIGFGNLIYIEELVGSLAPLARGTFWRPVRLSASAAVEEFPNVGDSMAFILNYNDLSISLIMLFI